MYSISHLLEILLPILMMWLTRDNDHDADARELPHSDVAVCPEGTACQETFLLRFFMLFAELSCSSHAQYGETQTNKERYEEMELRKLAAGGWRQATASPSLDPAGGEAVAASGGLPSARSGRRGGAEAGGRRPGGSGDLDPTPWLLVFDPALLAHVETKWQWDKPWESSSSLRGGEVVEDALEPPPVLHLGRGTQNYSTLRKR
uniref:DUF834 domain-containing protein n=1 Tax=Oryza punctata TaxID=4537 RepID=A0A0E0KG90_ORYPU